MTPIDWMVKQVLDFPESKPVRFEAEPIIFFDLMKQATLSGRMRIGMYEGMTIAGVPVRDARVVGVVAVLPGGTRLACPS